MRRSTREDFATLQAVYVGGEKLTERVASAFEGRFGIRPYEGYGTTELSPVAAFNLADVTRRGVTWTGARDGSIGRPVPGVCMRVLDPVTGEILPRGSEGVLAVKGPNVMRGYLGRDDLTAEVIRDGWYMTGDVARIDDDGFVFIVDRMSRFSKIGGEMIPHAAVEEVLLAAVESHTPCVAVTGVRDDRKGERLAVLYTREAGDVSELQRRVRESGLPNLWRPRDDAYCRVDAIPLLGTGKLDLRCIREMAAVSAASGAASAEDSVSQS
jgi:acyl-[acyl-carrier-protein]-phospholipid O-acyltransferase/long-chain-fatty-acid--[acyl-carrier-protein] ligase